MLDSRRFWIVLSVVLAFISSIITSLLIDHYGVLEPKPYRVIPQATKWQQVDNYVNFQAEFIKDGCVFDTLIVRGEYFERMDPRPIPWTDIHGSSGDRLEGRQGIHLRIGPLRYDYDALELMTRHWCGEKRIDRLFERIELK